MPTIHELFGRPINTSDTEDLENRKIALCPFTKNTCDGGGNRHQTKIKLSDNHKLRPFFSNDLNNVVPGICSIDYGTESWIVCPRRLLGFKHDDKELPIVNFSLQNHEKSILRAAKIPSNTEVGIWPEVYLRHGNDEENSLINYHFDFVACPIRKKIPASQIFTEFNIIDDDEKREIFKCAKTGKLVKGKYSDKAIFDLIPDLSAPIIIEIMTASTSGSDTAAGTNIGSAFTLAILGKDHQSPGINKRQVWGRMATQLFAKSALAEAWGGETVWVVQDQLLKNIELTTKLSLETASYAKNGNINFISMAYNQEDQIGNEITLKAVSRKKAGINFSGNDTAVDILLPKINPDKKELLKAILRRSLSAIVNLPSED